MINIERFVCNPFQENCYIVSDDSGECVIIDCGAFYEEERKAVVEYIKKNNLKAVRLIATHAHIDHNFGNNTIYKEFALKPEVSGDDESLMGQLAYQAKVLCGYTLTYEMPPVGRYFREGEKIAWGNHEFEIISTPGHSPGSVFFYCESEGLAFSGDTLFRMSIGRTDFIDGSLYDIQQSLRKIVNRMPDNTIILSGHGGRTTIGEERKLNPYLRYYPRQ